MKKKKKNFKNENIIFEKNKKKESENEGEKSIQKCPTCQKKLKWKKLMKLSFEYINDLPVCPLCEKSIIGSLRAIKLPCSDVFCSKCVDTIIKKNNICPKCSKCILQNQYLTLNQIIYNSMQPGGQITLRSTKLIDNFG